MKKASEILREAASEVDAHWVRNNFVQSGRVCAMGAINKSMWGQPYPVYGVPDLRDQYLYGVVTDSLARVFIEQGFPPERVGSRSRDHIVYVNDRLAKSRKDISSCMEKAAAQLGERGD
jgi:hypothetical protein